MKTGVIVGIVAVVLIAIVAVFFVVFGYSSSQSSRVNQEGAEDDSGASLLVPAPGNENVEETTVNQGSSGNQESQSQNQEFTVEITSSGFNQKTLEINQGDTVTWVNKMSSSSWPASAVHPTHNVYPGFDANKGLKNGESYSFTFDRVGSWNYHDHLSPSTTGTIIVK